MAMTTLFLDGFDHYSTADIIKKYAAVNGTFHSIQSATARNGGQALRFTKSTALRSVLRPLGIQARTVVVGQAIYLVEYPATPTAGRALVGFSGGGAGQCAFYMTQTGALSLYLNTTSTSTLLGTTSGTVATGQWAYLEFRITIDNTAGEWEVRLNGVSIGAGSGLDTQNSASLNYVDHVEVAGANNAETFIDDLYIRGDTVLTAGGFLGDGKIITRYPTSDGTYNQFARSAGSTNYENVDEALPDTADYIYSNTAGHKNTFGFAALADPGSVQAVQLNLLANKETAGYRALQPVIKSGVTEETLGLQAVGTDPAYRLAVWEQDPNTEDGWQITNLDNAEFGLAVG